MNESWWRRFLRSEDRPKPQAILARSGLLTAAVLACVLLAVGLLWRQRGKGNFHRLTAPKAIESAPAVRPGGQDAILLSRLSLNSAVPEFLSAELLPGLGMRVLQLTVNLPEAGEVPLMIAPSLNELGDASGNEGESLGAPFSVALDTRPKSGGSAPNPDLLGRAADAVESNAMPDGGSATAKFYPTVTDPDGTTREHGIQVTVNVLLSGRAVDLMMTARNLTSEPHDVVLRWGPRFRAASGNLQDLRLLVPSSERRLGNSATSVHGSAEDFSGASGAQLGKAALNATYVNLKRSFLGNGPVVELRDMHNAFGLRLTALSPSIHSLHVETSPDGKTVQLAYSTAEAAGPRAEVPGVPPLRPGQQMQWKVRLELAPLAADKALPQTGGFPAQTP